MAKNNKKINTRFLSETEKKFINLILENKTREECIIILGVSDNFLKNLFKDNFFISKLRSAKLEKYNSLTAYEKLNFRKKSFIDYLSKNKDVKINIVLKNLSIGSDAFKYWILKDNNFIQALQDINFNFKNQ